jgi:Fur family transcriptional regulator, iron response regulator
MMAGSCHDVETLLRGVGLRPTRQRISLGYILLAKGNRHVTAEMLYREATEAKAAVSLATVYNTLHQFSEAGLLRQVAVDGPIVYFDTNASHHHHFLAEGGNLLGDIPDADVIIAKMPIPPEGCEITCIDVLVRLRVKSHAQPASWSATPSTDASGKGTIQRAGAEKRTVLQSAQRGKIA